MNQKMNHTNNTNNSHQKHCSINKVAIFGSADIDEHHSVYQDAFQTAAKLASLGKVIVNGGGPGVMNAATQGAKSVGGKTIAVTFQPINMPEFEGKFVKNKTSIEIKTQNYPQRLFGLIDKSDAFVIFAGGTGTLSEWTTAWLLAHLNYGNHKPLILYGDFWHEVLSVINQHFFIGQKENQVYAIVTNLEEMVTALNKFEQDLNNRC
jgi:uncharacterized protein (TIGR00730 family)